MAPVPAAVSPLGFSMNNVLGPVAAVAGTCNVSSIRPRPISWLPMTITSGTSGPLTVYRNEESSPDGENTQSLSSADPLAGLAITTGLAPSEQDDDSLVN